VRLYKLLPDGRRQITGFMSAGHLLGLAPEGHHVYAPRRSPRYLRATTRGVRSPDRRSAGLARRLLAAASHELSVAQNQMLLLGRKTAVEKVASFILLTPAAGRRGRGARRADDAQ
jgi:CRP/FNR family transcriptional regulator